MRDTTVRRARTCTCTVVRHVHLARARSCLRASAAAVAALLRLRLHRPGSTPNRAAAAAAARPVTILHVLSTVNNDPCLVTVQCASAAKLSGTRCAPRAASCAAVALSRRPRRCATITRAPPPCDTCRACVSRPPVVSDVSLPVNLLTAVERERPWARACFSAVLVAPLWVAMSLCHPVKTGAGRDAAVRRHQWYHHWLQPCCWYSSTGSRTEPRRRPRCFPSVAITHTRTTVAQAGVVRGHTTTHRSAHGNKSTFGPIGDIGTVALGT